MGKGGKWVVGAKVGEGACGQVYEVVASTSSSSSSSSYGTSSSSSSCRWVAKVIPLPPSGKGKAAKEQERLCNTLFYEYTLFHGQLAEFTFRPAIPDLMNFHGVDDAAGVRYLIMERFERDLVAFAKASPKPTPSQVAAIGLQVLEGLEWLHRKGLLFIDVKPDNFMLNADGRVSFVDYGLVERWVSPMGGAKPDVARAMVGTPTFASVDVHRGRTPMRKVRVLWWGMRGCASTAVAVADFARASRLSLSLTPFFDLLSSSHMQDDVESMGLVLLSLFSGGVLPWSVARSDEECLRLKTACDVAALAATHGCPEVRLCGGPCL